MSKLLVIVGATGSQGRAVISFFQQHEPTWRIRGLTRSPSSEAAGALTESGVEIVKADANDVESLKSAFNGADYIFAYTDFGGAFRDALGRLNAGLLPEGTSVGAEAAHIEELHGRNIADAAATVPGLLRMVWSAAPDARKLSGGKYSGLFNMQGKAAVTDYMLSLPALAGKVGVLHLGAFLDTVFKSTSLFGFCVRPDQSVVWRLVWDKSTPVPWVDVEKDTGAFVKALIDSPSGTQVLGVSEWLSGKQFLALWSESTGHEGRFAEVEKQVYLQDDPTGMKAAFWQTGEYVADFGFAENDQAILSTEDLEAKGLPISKTNVADYMERQDWIKVLAK